MDDQSATIAFLAAGAGLARGRARPRRIDTHASFVFLIGDCAFKLKRAVRFSYLDYSTIEKREAACRAELEVNRRAAPELYLGVRAIRRRADGRLGFDGAGETLDWVVEMRRFDARGLFDRMAEEGRLTEPLMRDLADRIAAFHAACVPSAAAGGRAAMARILDGNRDNLRLAGTSLDQNKVAGLDANARTALARAGETLERRRGAGKVRACHGDLHLGNICLWNGKPTLFDAIEFSAELTMIDVLYDLAFLLMDLLHRDLRPFASLVFNRYLDLQHEHDGLSALPLFLSARAAIRAHVATAAARQQEGEAAQTDLARARSYLDLALALLVPASPRLVAIGGRSGSGKSTLAQALAPSLAPAPGARVLRSDVLRKTMLGLAPEAPLPSSAYSEAMGRKVYARLLRDAVEVLHAGHSVVLDATFLDPASRAGAALVAAHAGVSFTGLWLEAPRGVMAARIGKRHADASDATVAVLDRQMQEDPGRIAWARVETGGPFARSFERLRQAAGLAE